MDSLLSIPPPFPSATRGNQETNEENKVCEENDESMSHDSIKNNETISHKESLSTDKSDDDIASQMSDDSTSDANKDIDVHEVIKTVYSIKDAGTEQIKINKIKEACSHYKKGLSKLKHITTESQDPDIRRELDGLRVALNLNLSLCHMKLKEWNSAIDTATCVLKLDSKNVKALYRRGMARSEMGYLDDAKSDLTAVVALEPKNIDVKRALQTVKKRIIEERSKEKEKFGGLFAKAEGLYEDRERQIQQQKQNEELQFEKDKKEFEEENRLRTSKGEKPFESIDEWKTSKNKNVSTPMEDQQQKTKPSTAPTTLDFDEEDEKILEETKKMGYCYFNRPKVDDAVDAKKVSVRTVTESTDDTNKKSISSWNSGGTTYEERDCSSFVRSKFEEILKKCSVITSSYFIEIISVDDVSGDAQIVILRSSKRYLYDISCKLRWILKLLDSSYTIEGSLKLTDITPVSSNKTNDITHEKFPEWLLDATLLYETSYDKEKHSKVLEEALHALKKDICAKMKLVEEEYRQLA